MDYQRQDVILGAVLFALVPCHLFVAFLIELTAAEHAKEVIGLRKKSETDSDGDTTPTKDKLDIREYDPTWQIVGLAHAINATLCLLVTSLTVFFFVHHPWIGTISQVHAIMVWLKNCSYAFTNRDLRHANASS